MSPETRFLKKDLNSKGSEVKDASSETGNGSHIASGYFGKVYTRDFTLTKSFRDTEEIRFRSKKVSLVEKISRDEAFHKNSIKQQLKIHKLLKTAGIKTFNTFRSDEKSFYSTPLNVKGVIALSGNNGYPKKSDGTVFKKTFLIKNLDEVIDKIIDISLRASSVGLSLRKDCLFFLVNENELTDSENKEINLDLLVGDFDCLEIQDEKNVLATRNITELAENLAKLMKLYVRPENRSLYLEKVRTRLHQSVGEKEILTKSGTVTIIDYKKEDGEALNKNFDVSESWTKKEVLKVCDIPGLHIDLTYCKKEIKDEIVEIKGGFGDSSVETSYKKLKRVGGEIYLPNLKKANGLNSLESVGGSLNLESIHNSEGLENLTTVWGYASFNNLTNAKGLRVAIGESLKVSHLLDISTIEKDLKILDYISYVGKRKNKTFDTLKEFLDYREKEKRDERPALRKIFDTLSNLARKLKK